MNACVYAHLFVHTRARKRTFAVMFMYVSVTRAHESQHKCVLICTISLTAVEVSPDLVFLPACSLYTIHLHSRCENWVTGVLAKSPCPPLPLCSALPPSLYGQPKTNAISNQKTMTECGQINSTKMNTIQRRQLEYAASPFGYGQFLPSLPREQDLSLLSLLAIADFLTALPQPWNGLSKSLQVCAFVCVRMHVCVRRHVHMQESVSIIARKKVDNFNRLLICANKQREHAEREYVLSRHSV